MKTIKVVAVDEIIEVDGGFFRIDKQSIADASERSYDRYFLKTIKSPREMKEFKKYVNVLEGEA